MKGSILAIIITLVIVVVIAIVLGGLFGFKSKRSKAAKKKSAPISKNFHIEDGATAATRTKVCYVQLTTAATLNATNVAVTPYAGVVNTYVALSTDGTKLLTISALNSDYTKWASVSSTPFLGTDNKFYTLSIANGKFTISGNEVGYKLVSANGATTGQDRSMSVVAGACA